MSSISGASAKGITSALGDEEFRSRLMHLAEARASEYASGDPFPHIVIDSFLPESAAIQALEAFPSPKSLEWMHYKGRHEDKLAFYEAERLPEPLRDVLYFLNSAIVLQFLEKLTGVEGLIPDPYFFGGGLHQTTQGGRLDVHADFSRSEKLNLDRRLNLIVYLNPGWKPEYNGSLELWDRGMTRCVRSIVPVFNRCVVFNTDSDSFHGHPIPLACPEEMSRKSAATYYYTAPREGQTRPLHYTVFRSTTGEAADNAPAARGEEPKRSSSMKEMIRDLTPPALLRAVRRLRR